MAAPVDDRAFSDTDHPSPEASPRCPESEASEVVEADVGFGALEVDVVVEVAQQPVTQRIRQRPQLLLGVLDHRTQHRRTRTDLRPGQPTHGQRHRILRGEPPHRAREIHLRGDLLVAAMTLHVDAHRIGPGTQELRHRQPERDQQHVLNPGMKRRGHLTQQHRRGLGVQLHRQVLRPGIGVTHRIHPGQHRRRRRHRAPPTARHAGALATTPALRAWAANTVDHRAKRGPPHRQRHRPPPTMLGPRDVQILHHDPPRHPVDGQVMHDQRQPTAYRAPTPRAASPPQPDPTPTAPPRPPHRRAPPPWRADPRRSPIPARARAAPSHRPRRRRPAPAASRADPATPAPGSARRTRRPPPGPATPPSD